MDIGIPAEVTTDEFRVGLTPLGVSLLTQAGHRCYIERGAGEGAGFTNQDYERAGGLIVYGAQEVYRRAELVLKVGCPTLAELEATPEGQTICAFWHLAARAHDLIPTLVERRITAIAYEAIQMDDGRMPVLHPLSEIAGRMSPQIAARWLQNDGGGSGILISGIAGIPPVTVCILGAGVVGTNAAVAFQGLGARVTVLDIDLARLRRIEGQFRGQVTTMVAYDFNVARAVRSARVVIGAVLARGQRAPVLVTREMVRTMRPKSVIIDISIDEGGCVETSRPMTHADPIFIEENVIHYCVPNMPGVVARTATNAYLNAAWPYIQRLADEGSQAVMDGDESLRRGVAVHGGAVLSERLASLVGEAGQER